jgi:hypothetical protein
MGELPMTLADFDGLARARESKRVEFKASAGK